MMPAVIPDPPSGGCPKGLVACPGLVGFVAGCPCSVRERGTNPGNSSRLAGPEIVA
jgi:hypothetical protein